MWLHVREELSVYLVDHLVENIISYIFNTSLFPSVVPVDDFHFMSSVLENMGTVLLVEPHWMHGSGIVH